MSVYQKPGAPAWYVQFEIRGTRVHRKAEAEDGTEATTRRQAEAVEKRLRAEVLAQHAAQKAKAEADVQIGVSLALKDCIARYMRDVGGDHAGGNAQTTLTELNRIAGFLGEDRLITDIGDEEVARLRKWRRDQKVTRGGKIGQPISDRTVNATILRLKALMSYVKDTKIDGKTVALPHEPSRKKWKSFFFKLKEEHPRELQDGEWAALIAAAKECYRPILYLAYLTGLRLSECLLLWSDVNFAGRQIVRPGKGDKDVTRPISSDIREVLAPLVGDHPTFVFTYVAEKTTTVHRGSHKGVRTFEKLEEGKRYPITYNGLKTEWKRLRKESGVEAFKFHDIRHDFCSKTLRRVGNLKLLKDLVGHASYATTNRYAHLLQDQFIDAMEGRGADWKKKASPTKPPRKRKAA